MRKLQIIMMIAGITLSSLAYGQEHICPKLPENAAWAEMKMYAPSEIAIFDGNWKAKQTAGHPQLDALSGELATVMTSSRERSIFSFAFKGDKFGLLDVSGPEAGRLEIIVNGQLVKLKKVKDGNSCWYEANDKVGSYTLSRFDEHAADSYKAQYGMIKLRQGIHQVTIRVAAQKTGQSTIHLGGILLNGTPVQCHRVKGVPKLAQQLKWDQKMERFEKADLVNPPAKDLILFVGSSTIENWKTLEKEFPGKVVLNRGVSGTKTIDLINYKHRLITPYHPKQIFIYEGDNDIGYKWTPEEILEQTKRLFTIVRAEKPNAEIIFISIKPSVRRLKDKARIERTNALIKDFVGQQPNTAYADVYSVMFTADGELYPEHYRADGLHLTPKGYEVWKKVISEFIK